MMWIASVRDGAAACERRGAYEDRTRFTGYGAGYAGRRVVAVAILSGGLFASSSAVGEAPQVGSALEEQGAPARNGTNDLDKRLNEGITLYTRGQNKEAEEVFRALWEVSRTYDVAANLGHAEFRLGKMREAAEHLSFAVRNWPVGKQDQRKIAGDKLAEAKAQVGALAIRVSMLGAEVSIDGKPVGKTPLAPEVYVPPGRHRIEVTLVGYKPASATVEVAKGASRDVNLPLRPVESGEREKNKALLWTGGVLSVAALGAGAGLVMMSVSKANEAAPIRDGIRAEEGGCLVGTEDIHKGRCDEMNAALIESDRYRNWSIAAFAVGGAIGAATITYLFWPSSKPEDRKGVRVTPVVTGSGGGFGVMGSF